jgi:hypothetical protein
VYPDSGSYLRDLPSNQFHLLASSTFTIAIAIAGGCPAQARCCNLLPSEDTVGKQVPTEGFKASAEAFTRDAAIVRHNEPTATIALMATIASTAMIATPDNF